MPDTNAPVTAFARATKQKAAMAVAIAGASGSGKTKTSLEVAVGLAGPTGTIGLIDTEGRRALHYARQYKFEHCDFSEGPFTPERCTQAIAEAHAKFDVVIFDSFSDEYEGAGGFLDIGAAESGAGWPKTKARHTHSIVRYIRQKPHFTIFCLRAQEKVKIEKVEGKTVFTPMGWMPICEKRFMYDMTLSLTLSPETPGQPRFDLPRKISDDFLPLFKDGQRITRAVGEGLRAWALDVDYTPPADKPTTIKDDLAKRVRDCATEEALTELLMGKKETEQIAWFKAKRPELLEELNAAIATKRGELSAGGAL